MDFLLKNTSNKNRKHNGRRPSNSFSFSESNSWSGSMSASNRALVILIENGGVDLGIPELVDKLFLALSTRLPIPDSAKNMVVNFLREKITSYTDSLIETAEPTLNRYNAAAPNTFGSVVVLRNGTASYTELKNTLIRLTTENKIMDVLILTHGNTNYISVTGGINGQKIRDIKTEAGRPLSIRSVYMMNCVGSTLNQAWIDAGAKVSSGAIRNNYLPEPTTFFFWSNWKDGQNFETAVTGAYRKTINLMNDAVNSALSAVPGLSTIVGNINFENMDFVRDSAPVIQGLRSATVNSDDLTFSQSQSYSDLATTVLPISYLQSLQRVSAFSNERTQSWSASTQCFDMIKGFEGFRANKYNDPVGHCTIGYGTLLHEGNCNNTHASETPYASGITEAQATQLLIEKANEFQRTINDSVTVELNQNQYDALVSFAYNIGSGAFRSSTLLKVLNKGDYAAVPAEIRKWTKGRVNGALVDLPGLVTRRDREANLFSTPVTAGAQSYFRSMTGVNYAVPGPYNIIRQPSALTCWAAVIGMMISWKRQQSYPIRTALGFLNNSNRYIQMFDAGQILTKEIAGQLYVDAGLTTIISFNPTIEGWENLLRTYGLLYVDIGYAGTANTHAIIVTGISGDGTAAGTNITYIDPDSGTSETITFQRFLVNYEAVGAVNWPYTIVHWPAAAASIAKSFSNYSQQFYDTGEHAMLGEFINAATSGPISTVRALLPSTTFTINTVPLTYGQIMTMADFYKSFNDSGDSQSLHSASSAEITRLKNLIIRNENFYKNKILSIGTRINADNNIDWGNATVGVGHRYIELALANHSHFSPPPAGSTISSANNKQTWERYHSLAIQAARAGGVSALDTAYPINAFGDHFLTDAFSAGHLINKELVINRFLGNMISGSSITADGDALLHRIANGALAIPAVNSELGRWEIVDTTRSHGIHVDLNTTAFGADVFYNVLKEVLLDTAHGGRQQIANLAVKAVHDFLNHYSGGVPVVNNKVTTPWGLTGDGSLNTINIQTIQMAVKQSVENLEDAIRNPTTSLATYYQKVWDYVPNLSHPTTSRIVNLTIDTYTTPSNAALTAKAIELVQSELSTLLNELFTAGKIRRVTGPNIL